MAVWESQKYGSSGSVDFLNVWKPGFGPQYDMEERCLVYIYNNWAL